MAKAGRRYDVSQRCRRRRFRYHFTAASTAVAAPTNYQETSSPRQA